MPRYVFPRREAKITKTIRVPEFLLDEIERFTQEKDISFNAFANEALRVAMQDVKQREQDAGQEDGKSPDGN